MLRYSALDFSTRKAFWREWATHYIIASFNDDLCREVEFATSLEYRRPGLAADQPPAMMEYFTEMFITAADTMYLTVCAPELRHERVDTQEFFDTMRDFFSENNSRTSVRNAGLTVSMEDIRMSPNSQPEIADHAGRRVVACPEQND